MLEKKTKEIMVLLTVFTLVISINFLLHPEDTKDKAFKFPEKNFETPEAAINHFVNRLAANDLSGALEACAINEGDMFDFTAMAKRLNAIVLLSSLAPSQSPVLAQINRITMLYRITNQVKFMIYSLLTDIPIDGKTIYMPDDAMIDSFVKNADSRKLAGLSMVKITLPISEEDYNSERAKKMFVEQARLYGADDSMERIVIYKFNNFIYGGGMRLLKYGKYWRIQDLSSPLGNTNPLGALGKITKEEFDQLDNYLQ